MKKWLAFVVCLTGIAGNPALPQSTFSGWTIAGISLRINSRWALQSDFVARSTDQWKSFQTLMVRPGIAIHFNPRWSAGVGYGFVRNLSEINSISQYTTENQVWEQVLFNLEPASGKRFYQILQRARLEQRFIPRIVAYSGTQKLDGRFLSNRFRYLVRYTSPFENTISFSKGAYWVLQDELLLNLSSRRELNGKWFSQNRALAGAGFRFRKQLDAELGYGFRLIAEERNAFIYDHILQFSAFLHI